MHGELDRIKRDIVSAVQFIYYDPKKPAIIETDASQKGLGTVLIQGNKPVRFLSKALTAAEMNYSNIERELLAILFACEKLHTYTFAREIVVKPMQTIFLKPISLAPSRLQRMLLRLTVHNVHVKYVGSKSVLFADTLSRLVDPKKAKQISGLHIRWNELVLVSRQEETKTDPTLLELSNLINTGWSDSICRTYLNIYTRTGSSATN